VSSSRDSLDKLLRRAPTSPFDSLLGDLTVALFSYNRPVLLERQVALWASTDAELLILDGSDAAHPQLSELCRRRTRLTYVHERSFARRFALLSQALHRPFAMILADDDTALRSGTHACLTALRANPNAGTCIGPGMFALADRPPGRFTLISARGTWLGGRIGYHLTEEDPRERMARLAFPFATKVYYGVQRADVLRQTAAVCGALPAHWSPGAGVFEQVCEELSVGLAPLISVAAVHTLRWDDPGRNTPLPSTVPPLRPIAGDPASPEAGWGPWLGSPAAEQTRDILQRACSDAGVSPSVTRDFLHTLFTVFPANIPRACDPATGLPVATQRAGRGVGLADRIVAGLAPLLHASGASTWRALQDLRRSGGTIDMAEVRRTGRFRLAGA